MILDQVEVFHWGIRFYQVGDYAKAALAFHDFLQTFPSPEVYHNLALSHHQLALRYACMGEGASQIIPFKLTLALDPKTRASIISLLDAQRSNAADHMTKALTYYQRAQARDPSYVLVYSNLGVAFLQQGDVYKAIATLQDALALAPNTPEVRNHLGVAFFLAAQPGKARDHLTKAHTLAPTYDAPLFNLGVMASEEGHMAEAQTYWKTYLALDSTSPWAHMIQKPHAHILPCAWSDTPPAPGEHIMGLHVEAREHEIPPSWGMPNKVTPLHLQTEPFKATQYPYGVMTLSHLGEIQMIGAGAGFIGTSTKGIAIGSIAEQVRERYGVPTRILHMTHGASWVYDADGIAFQLRVGQVISWLLY